MFINRNFQFVAERKTTIVFIERIPDVENLFKTLYELEHKFNPQVTSERKGNLKSVFLRPVFYSLGAPC